MGFLESIGEFDQTIKHNFRLIPNKDIHYHYLNHKVQNDLTVMLASSVKSAIIKKIKEAKYFFVILDCTPDASRMKQTTLVIRCVDVVSFPVVKDGYFLEFLNVENTSGLGLFGELEIALQSLDLNINDVRGQGYDTGSDMANSCVKERWFSKLKLIKSYFWTSMTVDMLNGIAILRIEKNMLKNVDVKHIINDFASKNAIRAQFR